MSPWQRADVEQPASWWTGGTVLLFCMFLSLYVIDRTWAADLFLIYKKISRFVFSFFFLSNLFSFLQDFWRHHSISLRLEAEVRSKETRITSVRQSAASFVGPGLFGHGRLLQHLRRAGNGERYEAFPNAGRQECCARESNAIWLKFPTLSSLCGKYLDTDFAFRGAKKKREKNYEENREFSF